AIDAPEAGCFLTRTPEAYATVVGCSLFSQGARAACPYLYCSYRNGDLRLPTSASKSPGSVTHLLCAFTNARSAAVNSNATVFVSPGCRSIFWNARKRFNGGASDA